jgi:hypothetical protein
MAQQRPYPITLDERRLTTPPGSSPLSREGPVCDQEELFPECGYSAVSGRPRLLGQVLRFGRDGRGGNPVRQSPLRTLRIIRDWRAAVAACCRDAIIAVLLTIDTQLSIEYHHSEIA